VGKKSKPSTEEFVLDSSVTLAWFFADEVNPYPRAVARRLAKSTAIVPSIWPLEVANVLLASERRHRSTKHQATKWLISLAGLPIAIEPCDRITTWGEVMRLARIHELSAYDATYLDLALRRGLALATLDNQLRAALAASGGDLYQAP
jgi:predicted nucleic acid-binding protein